MSIAVFEQSSRNIYLYIYKCFYVLYISSTINPKQKIFPFDFIYIRMNKRMK